MISSIPPASGRSIAETALTASSVAALSSTPAAAAQAVRTAASRSDAMLAAAATALAGAKKKATPKASKRTTSSTKGAGYASSTKKTTSSSASKTTSKTTPKTAPKTTPKATGELAFLDDPRISTEEKLFRFMMYVTEKYDRDLEQKMKEAGGKGTSTSGGTTTTTTKKKSSNPFSKIAGAIKTVFPAAGITLEALNNKNLQSLLKTFSGPALAAGATALGMPQLAPLLAKAGPQLAGVAFDLAKALDEPGGGSTTSTTTSGTSSSSGSSSASGGSAEIDRTKVMELQYAMEKQKEMFSLVSNILRSMHDMKMVAVHNVRS